MADLARALQTPVPATQPAPQTPQPVAPARESRANLPVPTDVQREAKNKRDQERRKAQRAAHAQAVEAALSKKKKRKSKKKAAYRASDRAVMKQLPKLVAKKKVRGRGRPPGSKNKPKPGLSVALVPAPGVLPRAMPIETDAFEALNVAMNALYALPVAKRVDVLTMLNRLFG